METWWIIDPEKWHRMLELQKATVCGLCKMPLKPGDEHGLVRNGNELYCTVAMHVRDLLKIGTLTDRGFTPLP